MLHVLPILDNSVLHGIADLQHRPSRRRVVTAHDVLDDHIVVCPLFGSEDRPTDNRRILVLGEVLGGISDLEESGTAVENWREAPCVSSEQRPFDCDTARSSSAAATASWTASGEGRHGGRGGF